MNNSMSESFLRTMQRVVKWYESERIRRIGETQRRTASGRTVPVIPPLPPDMPNPDIDPNPTVAICGECGLELKNVMSYYCANPRCPCGLGSPTCCATTSPSSTTPVGDNH